MGSRGRGAPKEESGQKRPVGRPKLPGDPAIRNGCRRLIPLALRRLESLLNDDSLEPRHTINAIKAVFDGAQRPVEVKQKDSDEGWVVELVPDWRAPGK